MLMATRSRRHLLAGLLTLAFFGVLRCRSRLVDGVDLPRSVDWKRGKSRVGAELLQKMKNMHQDMRQAKDYAAKDKRLTDGAALEAEKGRSPSSSDSGTIDVYDGRTSSRSCSDRSVG